MPCDDGVESTSKESTRSSGSTVSLIFRSRTVLERNITLTVFKGIQFVGENHVSSSSMPLAEDLPVTVRFVNFLELHAESTLIKRRDFAFELRSGQRLGKLQ